MSRLQSFPRRGLQRYHRSWCCSSSWCLARSPVCFHSQLRRCFSFQSMYPPFALGLPRSLRSSFRPSICSRLARSLPHLRATSFLLIYQSFWFSRRFYRNATARKEDGGGQELLPWLEGRRVAIREQKYDGVGQRSSFQRVVRSKFVLSQERRELLV